MRKTKFVVGPNQGFREAWSALLSGRLVRRAAWSEKVAYALDAEAFKFVLVNMWNEPWEASYHTDNINAHDISARDWVVMNATWGPKP